MKEEEKWKHLVEHCGPSQAFLYEDDEEIDQAILWADAVIKRATDAKELTDRFGVDGRALSRWLKEGK